MTVGVLSPHHPDVLVLRRPASASWVLREAKQVAPTTRLAGHEPGKSLRADRALDRRHPMTCGIIIVQITQEENHGRC